MESPFCPSCGTPTPTDVNIESVQGDASRARRVDVLADYDLLIPGLEIIPNTRASDAVLMRVIGAGGGSNELDETEQQHEVSTCDSVRTV